jgi:hypothetical protein
LKKEIQSNGINIPKDVIPENVLTQVGIEGDNETFTAEELNYMAQAFMMSEFANRVIGNFVTNLSKLLNDYRKAGGAEIKREDVAEFISTCIAISAIDFRLSTININGVSYALSDYKVNAAFMPFVMPRGVYASVGIEFKRLDNSYPWPVGGAEKLMNPIEFQQFQELVLSKFKAKDISWNGDMFTLTQPVSLVDVFGRLANVNFGVHTEDINGVFAMPTFLYDDVAKEYYYNTPFDVYLDALAHNIIAKLLTM